MSSTCVLRSKPYTYARGSVSRKSQQVKCCSPPRQPVSVLAHPAAASTPRPQACPPQQLWASPARALTGACPSPPPLGSPTGPLPRSPGSCRRAGPGEGRSERSSGERRILARSQLKGHLGAHGGPPSSCRAARTLCSGDAFHVCHFSSSPPSFNAHREAHDLNRFLNSF